MQIVPIVGRRDEGIRTGGIAGYAAESDGHRDGETPPAHPSRVERLLAADPDAFVAAPRALRDVDAHCRRPGPAANQAFNRLA